MEGAYARINPFTNVVEAVAMAENEEIAKGVLGTSVRYIDDWACPGWIYNPETNTYKDPEREKFLQWKKDNWEMIQAIKDAATAAEMENPNA